jgi:hypothetical protein
MNDEHVELDRLRPSEEPGMEEEGATVPPNVDDSSAYRDDPLDGHRSGDGDNSDKLERRIRRKLDFILLPFLALLFLLNSLDKSNVGNAETAGFTQDAGLDADDLNTSMGYFFAFFVALQPVGAAFGRRYGMRRWVPGCMTLWGFCTILHMWVRRKWQLIALRILIASLEAGFYPSKSICYKTGSSRTESEADLGLQQP